MSEHMWEFKSLYSHREGGQKRRDKTPNWDKQPTAPEESSGRSTKKNSQSLPFLDVVGGNFFSHLNSFGFRTEVFLEFFSERPGDALKFISLLRARAWFYC